MIILCNHIMDLWKKVFRSELSFRKEGTCRRPLGLIRKSVKLRYCSGSSLPKVLSNTTAQKITADARKQKKICSGEQSLKDHWSFYRLLPKMTLRYRLSSENNESFRKTFSKNTFGELLLTFQFFEQFDLKTRYFISNFQKLFSHRIFKNG